MRTVLTIFLPVLAFVFLTGFDEGRVVIRVNDEPIPMSVLYQRVRSQSGENVDKAATQRAVDSLIANHSFYNRVYHINDWTNTFVRVS